MGPFEAIFFLCLFFSIPFLFWLNKRYNSKDHTCYDKKNLKEDAKIIDISTELCGLKGEHKYRTTVTFDDGFIFVSHDTHREDSFLTYKISLPNGMREGIEKKAKKAHFHALGFRDYKCLSCGHTYEGKDVKECPKCGSNLYLIL